MRATKRPFLCGTTFALSLFKSDISMYLPMDIGFDSRKDGKVR